jgi:hypothetical protein
MRRHGSLHSLVVQARVLGRGRGSALSSRERTLQTPVVRFLHDCVCPGLVGWMIQ